MRQNKTPRRILQIRRGEVSGSCASARYMRPKDQDAQDEEVVGGHELISPP